MEEYLAEHSSIEDDTQSTIVTQSVIPVPTEVEFSHAELLAWALGCVSFSVLIFVFATIQYLRKVWNSPKAKRKKKKRRIVKRHEREEKSIEQAYKQGPTAVEEFLKQLKKKKKKDWLDIEFKTVCKYSQELPCDIAKRPENKQKNTYPTILPFDHSRVVLQGLPNSETCSDYINASFIDGHRNPKDYIIAQGPNRHTVSDFWKMIWYEDVHCIVMATNLFEHARQQCEKYWHNQHARYGDVDVWLNHTDILADFVIRTFTVRKMGTQEERIIKQFQFNGWSDHDCPNPTAVLEYRRRIRAFIKTKPGPLLVHCSKGSGRSGAFVTIDMALEKMDSDSTIDVLNLLIYLRGYRPGLVRTTQQYEFVYDTIAMYLQCSETVIDIQELPNIILKHAIKDPQCKLTGFEQQFKTLQTVVPKLSVGECAGGHRAENRRKSRDIMMQPPERSRPYLITHDSNESTDYINACYIDGYRHPNEFIVTQWPLKSTVNDIWRLVYDYNIPTLVILNDMPFSRNYPRFWPTEKGRHMPYGPLTVEFVEETLTEHVASRVFRVRKYKNMLSSLLQFLCPPFLDQIECVKYRDIGSHLADMTEVMTLVSMQTLAGDSQETAKTVRMFQLRSWANSQKSPTNPAYLIDLLTKVQEWQTMSCHGRMPTCVLSKNGVSRVGMYCALSYCWDKLKGEGQIDVFTAVKVIKMNRPQLIDNLVDYMYCYRFFLMFTKMFDQSKQRLVSASSSVQCSTDNETTVKTDKVTKQKVLVSRYSSPPTSFEYVDESPPLHHTGRDVARVHHDKDNPVINISNTISDNGERNRIIGGMESNNNDSSEENKMPKTKSAPQLASLMKKAFSTKIEIGDEYLEGAACAPGFPLPYLLASGPKNVNQGKLTSVHKNSCDNKALYSREIKLPLHNHINKRKDSLASASVNKILNFSKDLSPSGHPRLKNGEEGTEILFCDDEIIESQTTDAECDETDTETTPFESLRNSEDSDAGSIKYLQDMNQPSTSRKSRIYDKDSQQNGCNVERLLECPIFGTNNNNNKGLTSPLPSQFHLIDARLKNNVEVHCSRNNNNNSSSLPIPHQSFHGSKTSFISEAESYKTCSQGSSWSANLDGGSSFNNSFSDSNGYIEPKSLFQKFSNLCPTVPALEPTKQDLGSLGSIQYHLANEEETSDTSIDIDNIPDKKSDKKNKNNGISPVVMDFCDRDISDLTSSVNRVTDSPSNCKVHATVHLQAKHLKTSKSISYKSGEDAKTAVPLVQVHSPSPSVSLKSNDSCVSKRTSEESLIPCIKPKRDFDKVHSDESLNIKCSIIDKCSNRQLPNVTIKMETNGSDINKKGSIDTFNYITIDLGKGKNSSINDRFKGCSVHKQTTNGKDFNSYTHKSKSDTLLHCVVDINQCKCSMLKTGSNALLKSNHNNELPRVKSDSRLSSFVNLGFSAGLDASYSEC